MKTSLILLFTLFPPFFMLAQERPATRQLSKEQYLLKSKKQATTGFILMGTGAALGVAGYFLFKDNFDLWSSNGGQDTRADAGGWMFIAGCAAVATGGGFLIASGVNKSRAKDVSLTLKLERGSPIVLQGMGPNVYPAVSVRLGLN